jgi:hypothetical protein
VEDEVYGNESTIPGGEQVQSGLSPCSEQKRKNDEAQLSIDTREEKQYTYIGKREKENSTPSAKAGARSRVPVLSPHPGYGGRRGDGGCRGQRQPQTTAHIPESTSTEDKGIHRANL